VSADPIERLAVLTGTVDQLQSEFDELRRRAGIVALAVIAAAVVIATGLVMWGGK
jgi:hypothetical protein